MSTASPASELALAFRDLQAATEEREREHVRLNRYRSYFGRVIALLFVAVLVSVWVVGKTYNVELFKERLEARLTQSAPGLLKAGKAALTGLIPVYQEEVNRTYPKFSEAVTDAITKEAGKLGDTIAPLAKGDTSVFTDEADEALALELQTKFSKELKTIAEARALAKALRTQQLVTAKAVIEGGVGPDGKPAAQGPFSALHDIQLSLHRLGPPEKDAKGAASIESLGDAALDVVKAAFATGDLFTVGDEKGAPKAAPKGGKQP